MTKLEKMRALLAAGTKRTLGVTYGRDAGADGSEGADFAYVDDDAHGKQLSLDMAREDAELIASAVNNLPALLDCVEAAKAVTRSACDERLKFCPYCEAMIKLRTALAALENTP